MNFERRARGYHAHSQVQRDLAAWLAEWLPQDLVGRTAIELGAGTGALTGMLVSRGAKTAATDLFPAMIDEGRRRVPGADWSIADAWEPQVNRRRYDYVLSASLLQWAPEPGAVLRRWRELVADGGTLLVGLPVKGSLAHLNACLPAEARFAWRSEQEWEKAIADAGWTIRRVEADARTYRYGGARELLRSLHGTGAVRPNRLSTGRLRALIRGYDEAHRNGGGTVEETWRFLRVEAVDGAAAAELR